MTRAEGTYVGLMSGTSLDGISAAVARFTPADGAVIPNEARNLHFDAFVELLGLHRRTSTRLATARSVDTRRWAEVASAREYCRLAVGSSVDGSLMRQSRCMAGIRAPARDIRAIGTHGQTLWHEPGHSTWQLDAPAVIAERTGLSVVSDFRVRDVAAGGQGATARSHRWTRCCSVAEPMARASRISAGLVNVTVVLPNGTTAHAVRAFDTGPGVAMLDAVVRKPLIPRERYDRRRPEWAQAGPREPVRAERVARASVFRRGATEEHGTRAVRCGVCRSLRRVVLS